MSLEDFIEAAVERGVARALAQQKRLADIPADMLSVAQAAEAAGVSTSTIRGWLEAGTLTRYGKGRVVRIRRDELLSVKHEPTGKPRDLAAEFLGKK